MQSSYAVARVQSRDRQPLVARHKPIQSLPSPLAPQVLHQLLADAQRPDVPVRVPRDEIADTHIGIVRKPQERVKLGTKWVAPNYIYLSGKRVRLTGYRRFGHV